VLLTLDILGRKRTSKSPEEVMDADRHAHDIVWSVRKRGVFKIRKPEEKAWDH
jgi:hypothetical protein